jgi:hypothetical protein
MCYIKAASKSIQKGYLTFYCFQVPVPRIQSKTFHGLKRCLQLGPSLPQKNYKQNGNFLDIPGQWMVFGSGGPANGWTEMITGK